MAAPQASSRLEMLQARFQQKQLQEKEQKLLQLYDQQQQRAYQVVQRGSAGSNGSNHGSMTRTTTTTHTTSTSQGGKVRQMFDERRQTTVKGIDRSYPLEPLENKLRKQATNGLTTQRNGNLTTVNRQSVNVKRVARADVNSNVNGGKPVVSYREEVTRESFGPSVHRHDDEDEFGSENRVVNGHHRHDLDNEEEVLDQETIESNRMMAKIHLMGFDESLKHRVRNDLESEEFPEYLMADVPDKLPKRSVTKKLTQAEARLERFKNANAKRSNNNAPKQPTTTGAATKRRTEQMLPARSNSRGSEITDATSSDSARNGSSRAWERGRGNPENARDPPPKIRAVGRPCIADDEVSKTRRGEESPDIETRRLSSPGKVGTTTAAWRSCSLDNYYKSLSSDGKMIIRRGVSPRSRENIDFRSASADRETRASQSTSPEFFDGEGAGSTTTMTIDRRGSTSSHDREILTQQREEARGSTTSIDRKYAEITREKRSSSSPFFFRDSGESDATVSIDRKSIGYRSASDDRQTRETRASRSTSPEFFCKEGERSATTMMIDRSKSTSSRDREILTQRSGRVEDTATSIDQKYAEITRKKRSSSPFFLKEPGKSSATMSVDRTDVGLRSTLIDRETRETHASRSTSPKFFGREDERSATNMMVNERARGHTVSSRNREILTKRDRQAKRTTMSVDRKYAEIAREKRSSNSPFFLRESRKSGATIDRAGIDLRSISADRQTRGTRVSRSTSPEFFCKEDKRSATTMMIDGRGSTSSHDREILTKQHEQTKGTTTNIDRKYAEITRKKRSSSSPFFLRGSGKSGVTMSVDRTDVGLRSNSADRQTRGTRASRSTSPEFFCKEGERSATTMMIDGRGSTSSRDREILTQQSRRTEGTSKSLDRKYTEIAREKRSSSPLSFFKDSGKFSATVSTDRKNINYKSASADRQTRETRASRSTSPEFFCKEGERSATTMMIDGRGSTSSRDREILTQQSRRTEGTSKSLDRKYTEIAREKRSSSPLSFFKDSGKFSATVSTDRKNINYKSASADRQTRETRASQSTSPEFFCKEGEKSATTMMIDGRGSTSSRDREILTQQSRRTEGTSKSLDRKYTEIAREKRSSSPLSFFKDSGKFSATVSTDRKNINYKSASADRQTRETRASQSTSPEFFCKEGEKSATTMMIDGRGSTSSRDREILTQQSRRTEGTSRRLDRKYTEIAREKRSLTPQFFSKKSERSATITLIKPKSSSMDITKSILKRRKCTLNTSYKQPVKASSSTNKEARFTRIGYTPSSLMSRSETKRSARRNEVSSAIVRSDSRRSSKISDISATSASSIVSLKYGLEFDNILQSTGLVRKFMKSQKEQRKTHHQLSTKRDIKNINTRAVRDDHQLRNRCKVSPLSQKSSSPTVDSKQRTTPEYSRKSITPTEVDVEIQEITMTDHRMERSTHGSRKSSSPEQPKSRIESPNVSTSSRKMISPKRDCGRQYGAKFETSPRFSSLRKTARRGADIPKTTFIRRVADQREDRNYASKYATYTIKDRKRQSVLVARKGSPDLSSGKVNTESKFEESKDAREFSKAMFTRREDESGEKDTGRVGPLSIQESATRGLDSVGSEHSARSLSEISLRTMDVQTKAPAIELNARSTVDSSREVTSDTTLRSSLRTPTGRGSRVGKIARGKSDLKTTSSMVIRSSRKMTKTYRNSSDKKPGSAQKRSPTCKRQLFEFDSEKEVQKGKEERTNWSCTKARKRENYSSADIGARADEATSKLKSLEDLDVATIPVKPLRSIEDIRKSIDCREQSGLTAAKRSRSAIANWRSSTSRESGDARRSISASGAARRADEPARLTKVQSCVSRIAKSPSPDASARKQHETSARATRGSAPSSPSKSPDRHVAPRRGSTEPKNQDARLARRPVVAKAAESIGSKTTTEAMDAVDGVVQQDGSPRESSAKKSDAFVIDLDDRPKESDTTPPKKVTPIRRSSNDKNQTTSSATGRPSSSVSSNFGSAGTTQSQASSTKSRMATRAKTPVSGGSQARGPSAARNVGNTNSADNLVACHTCGRNFAQDRIDLHQQICAKTTNKKRKQFDAMTFRVRGTELEPFVKKGVAKKQESRAKKPGLKSNWRRKHEEFIETIRSAKMVQSHLAAGGSLKDLPPPPPSDTSDYIQCPHCSRRFNQAAAERHIPKCEHMLHNKPAHARAARPRR
ncbi:serine-rich adhesin for platelets-like isoform X1 [Odontomachus brunneus]|uniref:serine-rich adhesin for platelets-like isoform X1 n=1 Tax=Odontomachus brunneus TaxID=486640 RepID=UPI0013F20525|nr:serine-rich adhesin for platelets-like isoform X1 [Odontomachus brunneus]